MKIKTMKYFISGWKEYIRFICLKKKKTSYHQNPLSHLALFVLNWFWGKRCFSQLSTLFEHFFCGSSAVLCVGTKQLSINFKSKHHTWVPQVSVLFVWGWGIVPQFHQLLIPSGNLWGGKQMVLTSWSPFECGIRPQQVAGLLALCGQDPPEFPALLQLIIMWGKHNNHKILAGYKTWELSPWERNPFCRLPWF